MTTYALKPTDPLWRRLQSVFDAMDAADVQIDHCAGTWIVHDLTRKRSFELRGLTEMPPIMEFQIAFEDDE